MAASSGRAVTSPGEFTHRDTRYRVQDNVLHLGNATKLLTWFIGSGAVARSYVLADDGFLFEAPVAYYTRTAKWNLAPGYDRYAYPYLTRPIAPACLSCHASFLNVVEGTQNRYATPPFAEGGVACERCHGPGEAHIAKPSAAIVNPAKLPPDRRDAICSQCHLTGEVRVMRPGRDWRSYRAGERLSETMTVFVRSGVRSGARVTSHVEDLARSACKLAAGDKLWCGSCHDPHATQARPVYRARCASCHTTCKETASVRRKAGDDCVACHMPKNPVVDAQHVVFTDHSIPRRPRPSAAATPAASELTVFGGGVAAQRDLALAYAIVAGREGGASHRPRARDMLEKARAASPDDVEVLLYLAEIHRNAGRAAEAIPLYERAMRLDPSQVAGPVGLGGIRMERGEYAEAIRLWEDALARNTGLQLVRMNLAMAYARIGNSRQAVSHLERALELNPGFPGAADLLARLKQSAGIN